MSENVKYGKPLALGIAAALLAAVLAVFPDRTTRSAGPLPAARLPEPPAFDPTQSAALFVGISEFTDDRTWPIPYAVDDAVDLAYTFALGRRVRLVTPERVVLALSGHPRKQESRWRLAELKRAGAQTRNADQSDILAALESQASAAGKGGILIVALATHGFNHHGVPYVLGRSSIFRFPETALSTPSLLELAASSPARRSLILFDACRERIEKGTRAGTADERTAAPLLRRMRNVNGQVVLYAAAAGGYSHDDPKRENGVFTRAILDGLDCQASKDDGVITVENLHKFVERKVLAWIRAHSDPSVAAATQINMDGNTRAMPLACCSSKPCWPIPEGPESASIEGSTVTALARDGKRLWDYDVRQPIVKAATADLDADGRNEVVVATRNAIMMLDRAGTARWSAGEDGRTLQTFAVGPLFRKDAQRVVVLWNGDQPGASHVSIVSADGQSLPAYDHDGSLKHVAIFRPTNWHAERIVVATSNDVVLLNPSKPNRPQWHYALPAAESIVRMSILDPDGHRKRRIFISTMRGNTFVLDPDGHVIASAH